MNIFFLHWDPRICAMWHVDKHVIKMILESCQLLCSAHWMSNSDYEPQYKLTHKNHPSSLWVRESLANYKWLCLLTKELCKEYTYRYGKIHKCQDILSDLIKNLPPLPDKYMTMPKLAMPDQYKYTNKPIKSYRQYYIYEKYSLHSWKKRNIPEWCVSHEK